jgi:stalled ribosome rescue protein Dom34
MEVLSGSKGVKGLIGEIRLSYELEIIDELFERVSKGGLATYGRSEVLKVLEVGAVEHLVISESVFKEERGGPLLALATSTGARCSVISSRHEKGRMFSRMGGIAALLRFRSGR